MLVQTKSIFTSKTLWFNVIGGLVVLLEYVQTLDLSDGAMQILAFLLVAGNAALRLVTNQPVSMTGKSVKDVGD